jgi:Zn-finger nucleic acid-binding protein
MKCPKCDALLNEVTRAGVLIGVCPRCLGIWLERGELEKIGARLREVDRYDDDDDDRYRRPPEAYGRPEDEYRRPYPKKKRWSNLFEIFD